MLSIFWSSSLVVTEHGGDEDKGYMEVTAKSITTSASWISSSALFVVIGPAWINTTSRSILISNLHFYFTYLQSIHRKTYIIMLFSVTLNFRLLTGLLQNTEDYIIILYYYCCCIQILWSIKSCEARTIHVYILSNICLCMLDNWTFRSDLFVVFGPSLE